MPLISLESIVKKYQIDSLESTILKGVSLTIEEGDMVAIVGASLASWINPAKGTIICKGRM